MKIISLIILSLLISYNAYAVDIYKCNIDKRTEIATCGFYNKCMNVQTNKEYILPFVDSVNYKSSYTVLAFEDKLIVKRDFDKYEFVYEKNKNNEFNFLIAKDNIQVFTYWGSFALIKNNFYHELQTKPSKIIHSGTCKKE